MKLIRGELATVIYCVGSVRCYAMLWRVWRGVASVASYSTARHSMARQLVGQAVGQQATVVRL
eukprot:1692746-Pleurochrysis_carterae.AAC.1